MKERSKTRFGTTHMDMIDSVISFAFTPANMVNTQSIKAWESLMQMLQSNLQTIDHLRGLTLQAITGFADKKNNAKRELVQKSAAIMSGVYCYAIKTGNLVLAAEMRTTNSSLSRKKYQKLVYFTQAAINIVTPLVPELEQDYNISNDVILDWQKCNDALNDSLTGPNNAIANRVALNQQIQQLMHDSVLLLTNQADGMALNFRNNPDTLNYYNQYKANRKLKPTGHVPTQLRATVTDGDMPVSNAMVSIDDTNLRGNTNENGYCNISPVPFGKHSITVTKGNISKIFHHIRFKKGQSLTLHFNLQSFQVPPIEQPRVASVQSG